MQIRCEQLHELVMVRVSHDGSGHTPAWFLEEIRARQKVYRLQNKHELLQRVPLFCLSSQLTVETCSR